MPEQARHRLDPEFLETLHAIRDQAYAQGFSLPGVFYTDAAWLEAERSELFLPDWFCAGRVDEVANPGDYFCFDYVGEPVLVVRGADGVLRALGNVCRHRGTVVASGSGNRKKFLCPYHHWAYDNTGQLINAPQMHEHASFDPALCSLPRLACETWQGFIFVNLNQRAAGFGDALAPLERLIGNYHLEQMRLGYLAEEVWDTNWKCLLENFMEGYHLTPLHKDTLHKVNPSRLCEHLDPGPRHFGYRVGFASRLPAERLGHPDLSQAEMDSCIMFSLPPGLAVGIGSDYCSFLSLRPLEPARVKVKMGLFFHGDDWAQADIDAAVDLFRLTMDEDKQVLLRVQQGLASRFHEPGPLAAQNLEGTIWDFYQYLSRRMAPVKSRAAIKETER